MSRIRQSPAAGRLVANGAMCGVVSSSLQVYFGGRAPEEASVNSTTLAGRALPALVLALFVIATLSGLAVARPETRTLELERLSESHRQRVEAGRGALYYILARSEDPAQKRLNDSRSVELQYIDERGLPVFYAVDNLIAARTISTDDVWPYGVAGYELTGAGTALGELVIWDAGAVYAAHQEFGGRVTQIDAASSPHFHATHVAGTMIAAGVHPNSKGMSTDGTLAAYNWSNDDSEMATAAAAGMMISNHSYGSVAGWRHNGDWYWYGNTGVSPVEDYGFGFYGSGAQAWDEIAYNAPYYTIVKSAGNDRTDSGPGPGGGHWVWAGSSWQWSNETREPDGGADGYDSISWNTTAKNIIAVGAAQDISQGWSEPGDVSMAAFSGFGPTDDGRIKPDLVANGVGLFSCVETGPTNYNVFSGTSMSSPNLSGSLNLLVRFFEETHGGQRPLAATMKALLIGTADEAGPGPGPDYGCGWGLMNTRAAAELIEGDGLEATRIVEARLENGASDEYFFVSEGVDPIKITIAWTDPPGTPPAASLDPPDLMLVNDLDLRIEHLDSGTVFEPYVLDPTQPASAASRGDNFRDNVEQVDIPTPAAGEYVVTVSHKGSVAQGQDYSVVSLDPIAALDSTGIDDGVAAANGFTLYRNFPNPFNPSTTIRYELASPARVTLRVHDVAGRVIRVLEGEDRREPGVHEITWDGRDDDGRTVASGVYFYRIDVGGSSETRRMVMLK
jgi:hypothetical protein